MESDMFHINYSLICAVREGNLERTKELINSFGLYYSPGWSEGYCLLCEALKNKQAAVAKLLLTYDCKVKGKNIKPSHTPLHLAVENGDIEIVEMILNKGATIDAKNKDGCTPLYYAIRDEKMEITVLLLKYRANVDHRDNNGQSLLHIAIEIGFLQNVGHETVVKLLLEHGAKVDNQDKDGRTILNNAVKRGYLLNVKYILEYCPDIVSQSNRNSLKIAVQGYGEECKKIVKVLLEYGFIVNSEDANDTELLHAAVGKGYLKIVEDLLKFGANVNKTYRGFTPLHNAVKEKQEEVAKLLINYEADINAQDEIGKTPIFYAIKNADLKITKLLLSSGVNIKNSPELLNVAVTKEYIEIIEALLQHDADINFSDQYGRTALHFTTESVNFLKPDITINGIIAKMLLSKGANVNSQAKSGLTTLHAATKKGYVKVVEALLEYNANVDCREKRDITPLHLSALTGNEEISTMLLNKGANVNAKGKNGFTALHIAIGKGYSKIVKLLLECGAKIDPNTESGCTALHLAAQNDNQKVIETILKFGVDINSRDVYGKTALHIASREGHIKVVTTLLEYGSDINITNYSSCTPHDYAKAGIMLFHNKYNDYDDYDDYDSDDNGDFIFRCGSCPCEEIDKALQYHIVKMKTANLYVSRKNLLSLSNSYKIRDFQEECEKEIASMKSEKINNANISFYDILTKGTSSLEICMRNENMMQILKSDIYKTKFPIYASMIENHLRKGMERKELLKQGNTIFCLFFNNFLGLSHDCTEKIFSYLSNEDLRILMDACKPLSISYPDTNY